MLILIFLSVIAAFSRGLLPAKLIEGNPFDQETNVALEHNWRQSCTSSGSLFDMRIDLEMDKPHKVHQKYKGYVEMAFMEREKHFQKPSMWKCDKANFEDMVPNSPTLTNIALQLPEWKEDARELAFSDFSLVMSELQRVYECKLLEMQRDTLRIVFASGSDVVRIQPPVLPGESPFQPAVGLDEAYRVRTFRRRLDEEKSRSRSVMEWKLNLMRSFELAAPFSIELHCLQREAADMNIALTLLADTVSCLPRVWDISTSLHDRAGE